MFHLLHKVLRLMAYRDQYEEALFIERGWAYLARAVALMEERGMAPAIRATTFPMLEELAQEVFCATCLTDLTRAALTAV